MSTIRIIKFLLSSLQNEMASFYPHLVSVSVYAHVHEYILKKWGRLIRKINPYILTNLGVRLYLTGIDYREILWDIENLVFLLTWLDRILYMCLLLNRSHQAVCNLVKKSIYADFKKDSSCLLTKSFSVLYKENF